MLSVGSVFSVALLLVLLSASAFAGDPIDSGFKNPPATAKARTWWHWINGNVSKKGITADLEAIKAVGIEEVQVFNVNLKDPQGPAIYLGPEWLELFAFAGTEAKRLGLELSFHNGPGWSSSGGPWVTPEYAMQTVVFSQLDVSGKQSLKTKLPLPEVRLDHYRDIAVLAFPKLQSDVRIDGLDYKNLSGRVRNHLYPDAKTIPDSAIIEQSSIVDLTNHVSSDGTLEWEAPAGEWTILRLGHTAGGNRNRPAPKGGQGLECDKMSRAAVDAFWKGGIAPIVEKIKSVDAKLSNCVIDSYEVGTTNWTPGFDQQFLRLRGYDCTTYLPTMAGYYVQSGEQTERFLWDFRRTIGDLMAENYYGHFRKLCHQNAMKLSVEPYWGPFDNMQVGAQGDIVMCEFWSGDIAFFDSPKFVASIAKLNGDTIVGAEAFTGLGGWVEHPATIKSIGDRAWAQGINRFIFHSYVHQPWDVGPGLTLSYHGLELNRLNTWWKQGKSFLDYVARGQFLLQQGQSVADVLLFTGQSSPNDAWLMPKIKSMGFDYDLIGFNSLDSLSVSQGMICTPTGGSYRAMLLPETVWMTPQVIEKLKELVDAGATILGPQPLKSPSLQDYPQCDQRVAELARKLWGQGNGKRGIQERSMIDFLQQSGVPQDFTTESGNSKELNFIHRRSGKTDIYFVASFRKQKRTERCRFRVTGMQPEFFDAQTGTIAEAPEFRFNVDGTTTVPVELDPDGSKFIVFRRPVSSPHHIVEATPEIQQSKTEPLSDLEIVDARYGTFLPDGLVDVTEILTGKIENNRLQANANRMLMGSDPAPGYHKELRVEYLVDGKSGQTTVKEREPILINDAGKGELEITRAVFGKFSEDVVGVPARSQWQDVTSKVKSLVAAGRFEIAVDDKLVVQDARPSSFKRSNALLGNPPVPALRINYFTDGQLKKQELGFGETLSLTRDLPGPRLVSRGENVHWLTPAPGRLTYRTAQGNAGTVEVKTVAKPMELSGRWNVRFPDHKGAPERATLERLASWDSSADAGIRFFSGTAAYHQPLEIPAEWVGSDVSLQLDLGTVNVIAEVIVNGKSLGVLWKAPFRVCLDGAVSKGVNDLEIRVTNLWANRLIGDAALNKDVKRRGPAVKQWPDWLVGSRERTSGRVGFSAYRHYSADSPLQPSGLVGPVIVRPFAKRVLKVKF
jgi:hypothetical protein